MDPHSDLDHQCSRFNSLKEGYVELSARALARSFEGLVVHAIFKAYCGALCARNIHRLYVCAPF